MSNGISKEVAREAMSPDPSQLLEFFLIYYGWPDDQRSILALTSINNFGHVITWQGIEYISLPLESKGFNLKGDGELPRPRLTISNTDLEISKYLKVHNNLIGVKVIRKRTFAKFLDNVNFAGGKNPYVDLRAAEGTTMADQNAYLPDQTFYINRRVTENKQIVEFELSSVLEMENVFIPNRNSYARYCTFLYRGHGCRYVGDPKRTANSQNFTDIDGANITLTSNRGAWSIDNTYNKGDFVFIETENYTLRKDDATDLDGPQEKLKTFYVCRADSIAGNQNFPPISKNWQRDECSKKISDCKLRFNTNLRFGGFPGCHEYAPN